LSRSLANVGGVHRPDEVPVTFYVEVKSTEFSCPVSFKSEAEAVEMAKRWRKTAFRVQVIAVPDGKYSGEVIHTF
jgi:hypothetical protein